MLFSDDPARLHALLKNVRGSITLKTYRQGYLLLRSHQALQQTISGCVRDSLGALRHKPEAFEISRMFLYKYVCISPNLPQFRGPGIEALKLFSTRVDRFRKNIYRWK